MSLLIFLLDIFLKDIEELLFFNFWFKEMNGGEEFISVPWRWKSFQSLIENFVFQKLWKKIEALT